MPPRNTTSKFIDGPEVEVPGKRQLFVNDAPSGMGQRDLDIEKKFDPNLRYEWRDSTTMAPGDPIANPFYKDPSIPSPTPTIPQPTNPGGFLGGTSPFQKPQLMSSPGMFGNSKFMGANPFGYTRPGTTSAPQAIQAPVSPAPQAIQAPVSPADAQSTPPTLIRQWLEGRGK